ncbi:glycoside hydrolase family 16 protein [Catenuloplanes indicus]|uniref:Beta-glucanase (GH16 family) n=1 Tax=Catenuloplanes indicus TaxID=137267 RepID=A0AAE3W325_9ACTN|nr:glycoside hydrolase family 16 protein [Catenuloplanes indicus]MDQ0368646.1 beta-glucanase (GH16 family) [Catenuloplanes indicus]
MHRIPGAHRPHRARWFIGSKIGRAMLALSVVATGLGGALYLTNSEPEASAASTLVWSDEFNGAAGTRPDGSKWVQETGGHGWGNNELQYYTNSASNSALDGNGNMVITARRENPAGYQCHYGSCQYTSARLMTNGKFTQTYGRFEARLKLPKGQGIWPAFWMLGADIGSVGWPNSGEIDIMENVGKEPNTVYGTIHGPGYSGGGGLTGSKVHSAPLGDAFHTYTVDWSPNLIVWYLDGVEYTRKTPANLNGNRWVFDKPFFMIMNLAVGGNWPGNPDGSTQFPQSLVADYVRVYSYDGGTTPPPATGGVSLKGVQSGRCIDVPNGASQDGLPLQIWDCNNTAAQKWTFNGNGSLTAVGKCMDVAGGNPANGTNIQLANCNGSGWQQFTLSGAGDLVNIAANKCVDVRGNATGGGSKLQLWDCAGTPNQKWNRA